MVVVAENPMVDYIVRMWLLLVGISAISSLILAKDAVRAPPPMNYSSIVRTRHLPFSFQRI